MSSSTRVRAAAVRGRRLGTAGRSITAMLQRDGGRRECRDMGLILVGSRASAAPRVGADLALAQLHPGETRPLREP